MKALIVLLALVVAGCSGSSTAPSPPPPVVVVPPVVPPAPVFPSVAGTWAGTVAFTLAVLNHNVSVTNVCDTVWTITQTGGTFTGLLTLSRGTEAPCSGGLRYSGSVSLNGAVALDINWPFDDASCGLTTTGQTMSGTLAGKSLKLTQKDTWLCQNKTVQVDRTLLVELTQ